MSKRLCEWCNEPLDGKSQKRMHDVCRRARNAARTRARRKAEAQARG